MTGSTGATGASPGSTPRSAPGASGASPGPSAALGRSLRVLVGLAISALFIAITVSRVNLAEVGSALGRVNFAVVLLALPVVALELVLRAARWQRLLRPIAAIPLRRCVAYLAVGYFANSMLPARLGDLARAYLAGRAFGVGRLAALGTIVVERLADGLFILALVTTLGLLLTGGATLASTALSLAVLAVIGLSVLLLGIAWLRRPTIGTGGGSSGLGRLRARVRLLVERVLDGARALQTIVGFAEVSLLTIVAFGCAVVTFTIVGTAAGANLSIPQYALAMGAVALSTSIPAAPGSIGTYEFVGLTILVALGLSPELALAVVVLVHLVTTLPLALAGLVATWQLHFRVGEIVADAQPGGPPDVESAGAR